ncbi:MAG: transcriptional repressor [Clostridia bacterium]|nr:transcriptional repressor [Clostridia bacterium]
MNTKQKALVLEVVTATCSHMTAEEIYIAAKAKMPQIAMGTVYRNLAQLVNDGVVRKLEIPNAPDRYDGCTECHEHLYCDKCGKVSDIWCGDLTEAIESATGQKLSSYTLTIRGLCSECAV